MVPIMPLLEHLREGMKSAKAVDDEMEELIQTRYSLVPWPVAQEVPSP